MRYPGGLRVHPNVFRSTLSAHAEIEEYQVCQTSGGVAVRLVATERVDRPAIAHALSGALAALGLQAPVVTVDEVPMIERVGIGKVKRFLPIDLDPDLPKA